MGSARDPGIECCSTIEYPKGTRRRVCAASSGPPAVVAAVTAMAAPAFGGPFAVAPVPSWVVPASDASLRSAPSSADAGAHAGLRGLLVDAQVAVDFPFFGRHEVDVRLPHVSAIPEDLSLSTKAISFTRHVTDLGAVVRISFDLRSHRASATRPVWRSTCAASIRSAMACGRASARKSRAPRPTPRSPRGGRGRSGESWPS